MKQTDCKKKKKKIHKMLWELLLQRIRHNLDTVNLGVSGILLA